MPKKNIKRPKGLIIAMDGPAGVGKSTVGQFVAKRLGYHFINTGEMYRALTWKGLEVGLDLKDEVAVAALARKIRWDFRPSEEGGTALKTWIDGEAVTSQIRNEAVSEKSSLVAAHKKVRQFFCRLQRHLGSGGGIVMEGRDITTHVFPDADFKIYLDASVDERAARRCRQLKAAGLPADLHKIREAILTRDLNDIKRKINPLSQASDAFLLDSTSLTMRQVAQKILRLVKNGGAR
ncbi:MAG: (d)CMP kinase [Elusimicrobia bacterium]|nr:(d)CMP kinase [Elusimicrobiota bacterium]